VRLERRRKRRSARHLVMGRGFKKPSGQLSPLRRGNSTQGEENAGGESLPADPGAAVADAKVSEKVDGANDHQHRPRSRGRRSKSSMASIAGSDERNSAVASGDGGKSQKLVWSPNQVRVKRTTCPRPTYWFLLSPPLSSSVSLLLCLSPSCILPH
jgi:hypothetical protein